MKTMTRLTTAFLGSLLVLLGFGGCRSSKRAAQKAGEALAAEEIARMDSAVNAKRPPIPRIETPSKEDPGRVRLLYGVPPTRFQERINKEK